MRFLIIGSGVTAHSIAWKLSQSTFVNKIYVAPGNAGTEQLNKVVNFFEPLNTLVDIEHAIAQFNIQQIICLDIKIYNLGLVDYFLDKIQVFGPNLMLCRFASSQSLTNNILDELNIDFVKIDTIVTKNILTRHLQESQYPIVLASDSLPNSLRYICSSLQHSEEILNKIPENIFKSSKIISHSHHKKMLRALFCSDNNIMLQPYIFNRSSVIDSEGEEHFISEYSNISSNKYRSIATRTGSIIYDYVKSIYPNWAGFFTIDFVRVNRKWVVYQINFADFAVEFAMWLWLYQGDLGRLFWQIHYSKLHLDCPKLMNVDVQANLLYSTYANRHCIIPKDKFTIDEGKNSSIVFQHDTAVYKEDKILASGKCNAWHLHHVKSVKESNQRIFDVFAK